MPDPTDTDYYISGKVPQPTTSAPNPKIWTGKESEIAQYTSLAAANRKAAEKFEADGLPHIAEGYRILEEMQMESARCIREGVEWRQPARQ